MNVLEHTFDVFKIMEVFEASLACGGVAIFADRVYDLKWKDYERRRKITGVKTRPFWDVGHPINMKLNAIDNSLKRFTQLHRQIIIGANYEQTLYFLGQKVCK